MPRKINLVGKQINNLVVVKEFVSTNKQHFCIVYCLCNTDKTFEVKRYNLFGKHSKQSCGCLNKMEDLVSKRFGKWIVLKFVEKTNNDAYKWLCKCELCGKEKIVGGDSLRNHRSNSCGCQKTQKFMDTVKRDLTGQIFGSLHVIRPDKNHGKLTKWLCECRCGKFLSVMTKNLVCGGATKCGKCTRSYKYYPFWEAPPLRKRKNPNNLYAQWRKAVFERGNFTCVICGKNNGIVAHHLNGWNWSEAGRYDIDNGCVLCDGDDGCHNKFHKQYGCGDNTKEQFIEFKNTYASKTQL